MFCGTVNKINMGSFILSKKKARNKFLFVCIFVFMIKKIKIITNVIFLQYYTWNGRKQCWLLLNCILGK